MVQSFEVTRSSPRDSQSVRYYFAQPRRAATRDMEIAIAQMVVMRILCFILSKVARFG
jgi:hypothetical protein